MKKTVFIAVALVLDAVTAQAQDARDAEIFGPPASETTPAATTPTPTPTEVAPSTPDTPAATPPAVPKKKKRVVRRRVIPTIKDPLQIGGRLEMRVSGAQEEASSFGEGGFTQLKQADVYFDSRPNPDVRAFLRARMTERTPTAATTNQVTQDIDELWFKWDASDQVFFTFGKQHLKWGSGRFWNPTDFTARQSKDPFELFDRRLGQEMFKIHVPDEKRGFNYYGILLFDDATTRNDDVGLALRGEFAFLGQGELALSFMTRRAQPLRLGFDVSSALGPIDVSVEAAMTTREQRTFYEGELDPATLRMPRAYQDEEKAFAQVSTGIQKSWRYSDEDNLTVGLEYFYNELGYEDRTLEIYSIVTGQSRALYAAREYAGAFILIPQPGSWNKTSFFINGLHNVNDQTGIARVTGTVELFREATLEVFASQCFGDYGEFCFRVPQSIADLGTSPALPPEMQQAVQALPTKRTMFNAGLGMTMKF